MSVDAGLDVSYKTTHICVVDAYGKVLRCDVIASDPDVLAKGLSRHCTELVRVVLETGPLSTFLYDGLLERGVTVECICARHAKGVLSARINKSDVHDAEGLAQRARKGWYKCVHMKGAAMHIDRAALRIRSQLITARTVLANQLRGLLKLFGLRMGTARRPGRRSERLTALYAKQPDLKALFAPLISSREVIEEQVRACNHLLNDRAKADEVCSRLMSVPCVGPITALTYTSTIEDPRRYARSEDVGAYWTRAPTEPIRSARCQRPHLESWRFHAAQGTLRSRQCCIDPSNAGVCPPAMRPENSRNQRWQARPHCGRPRACRTTSFALSERPVPVRKIKGNRAVPPSSPPLIRESS